MELEKQKQIVELPESVKKFFAPYQNQKPYQQQYLKKTGTIFEIDSRYKIIDLIGQGAYATVVAATDTYCDPNENNLVAIKKIEKAFEHKIFAKRTLRELKILRLCQHENVMRINQIILPESREKFNDIYVVSELMETDLAQIIKSPQKLTNEHCQFFLYQILRGLKYVHSAQILHRDLKPKNLLVNSNCDLKICDFGLARPILPDLKTQLYTDYVATRWYRAPELLLMYGQLVVFLPNYQEKSHFQQEEIIEIIFDVIGTPTEDEINNIPKQECRNYILKRPKREGKDFNELFPNAQPQAIDLLRKFLQFDPSKRITIDEALKHPYLEKLHCPEDEPTTQPFNSVDFEFEDHNLNMQQLKDLIYEEILLYHFQNVRDEYFKKKAINQSLISHILTNENSKFIDNDDLEDQDYE